MIEILKISEKKIETIKQIEPNCWINVFAPTQDEITTLKTIIEISDETLFSLQDIEEIPTIEQHGKFTFIIIRVPYNNLDDDLEYYTVPIGIFITNDFVMTLYYHENDVIPKLKTKTFPFRKTQFVFRLLLISSRLYLTYLNEINKKMYEIEKQLEKSQKNRVIMQLLEIQKSLVYFGTSTKSNEILTERLSGEGLTIKTLSDKKLIDKVMDENKQAIQMTDTYSNILSNTLDAFASIISNNLNIVLKVLTSITIIIALPTLVASIYGMNVDLPFQHSIHAFWIVMLLSFVTAVIAVVFFWKNNYL